MDREPRQDPSSFSAGPTRRALLLSLAALPSTLTLRSGVAGSQGKAAPDAFLEVSRIIVGTDALTAAAGARIEALLAARDAGFDGKLADLAQAMRTGAGDRASKLAKLTDGQVAFALQVAHPWYVGYVGNPSSFVLKDDAVFATFLEAQGWDKIIAEVPRITYPGHGAGWWNTAPPGVQAPAMPEAIIGWTFHPGGPAAILPPDPTWRAYATANHATIAAARQARPGGPAPGGSPPASSPPPPPGTIPG